MINVFVTNLGKYNEGELVGEWLTLPASEEIMQETFESIGLNDEYEEYFLTDWECDIEGVEIGEYSSLDELNEIAEKLSEVDDLEVLEAFMDVHGVSLDEAIDAVDDCHYIYLEKNTLLSDEKNLAYSLIEAFGDIEDAVGDVSRYFDYEAFGRDLRFDGIVEEYELTGSTDEEIGEEWVEMLGSLECLGKQTLEDYFDYEAFGRDLLFDYRISRKNMIAVSYY